MFTAAAHELAKTWRDSRAPRQENEYINEEIVSGIEINTLQLHATQRNLRHKFFFK